MTHTEILFGPTGVIRRYTIRHEDVALEALAVMRELLARLYDRDELEVSTHDVEDWRELPEIIIRTGAGLSGSDTFPDASARLFPPGTALCLGNPEPYCTLACSTSTRFSPDDIEPGQAALTSLAMLSAQGLNQTEFDAQILPLLGAGPVMGVAYMRPTETPVDVLRVTGDLTTIIGTAWVQRLMGPLG